MIMTEATNKYLDKYDDYISHRDNHEKNWLCTIRAKAKRTFTEIGFPHRKVENWKYTNINRILQKDFHLNNAQKLIYDSNAIAKFKIPALDCYQIVVVNGQPIFDHAQFDQLKKSIKLLPLSVTIDNYASLLQPLFDSIIDYKSQPFAALNTMFFNDGIFLEIKKNTIIDKPIHIINVTTSEHSDSVNYPRHFILLSANSQATIIETYHTLDEACSFTNTVSEIMLQENANLTHYKSHHENDKHYHIAGIHVAQQRDSVYQHYAMALGGELIRNDVQVRQQAKGADCVLKGFYRITEGQHIDYHTIVDHQQPHGTSFEHFKGILDGSGHGVFNGKVIVQPHAQKANATQINNNLLLTKNAEIDTKPELEIYADDVKCSHGATVGQLDDDALFYLQTRGFDEMTAKALLIYGFASDLINQISIAPLRNQYKQQLLNYLPLHSTLEEFI